MRDISKLEAEFEGSSERALPSLVMARLPRKRETRPLSGTRSELQDTTPPHLDGATEMRPFKPPTIVRRPSAKSHPSTYPAPPPLKRRKIAHDADDDVDIEAVAAAANILKKPPAPKKFQPPAPRKTLEPVPNPSSGVSSSSPADTAVEGYYIVVWSVYWSQSDIDIC